MIKYNNMGEISVILNVYKRPHTLEKQIEGAYVIGVGPGSMDGVTPTGRLVDIADAGFDNFSPESGGVIRIDGRSERISEQTDEAIGAEKPSHLYCSQSQYIGLGGKDRIDHAVPQ